jgi:histone H3/H4
MTDSCTENPERHTSLGIKKKNVRGRGKRVNSMRIYIKKLAKENVNAKLQISHGAAEKLEFMCDHLIQLLTRKANEVMEMKKSRTLNANCVQGAINLELHPSLAKDCDAVGLSAVLKMSSLKAEKL